MNVFKEMAVAIANKNKYPEFLNNKKRKVFGYGMLMLTIYFLITIIVPYVRFQVNTGGFKKIIVEQVPDFELSNGSLWVEKSFKYDDYDTYVEIETDGNSINEDEIRRLTSRYSNVLVLDQGKMIAKSNGNFETIEFGDIPELTFNRQDLIGYVPMANTITAIGIALLFVFQAMWFFFGVLILSLFGLIVNAAIGSKLTFGQVYLLTVYTRTLPLLIKAILSIANISIPFLTLISVAITLIYLVLACQCIKDQNQKTELPEHLDI